MLQYCNMNNKEWGNVRVRQTQILKIEGVIAGNTEYDSVSDFVSQKLTLALERVSN